MAELERGSNNPTDDAVCRAHENGRAKGPSKEGERWLLAVVQNTSDVVTLVDAEGMVRYVSPSIERMLGYRPQERMGRSCFDLLHPDDLARARSTFAEALRRPGDTLALGVRMSKRDGSWRQVEVAGTNLLDDGTVRGILINWRDVTDHKRAEKALEESEQRFKSSFQYASIGMALVGTDGRFLQVNRALCRIVGYSEEELLGKTFQDITHPEDLEADVEQVRRMLAGEIETYQMEKRYLHKDGHVVWVLLSVSLVHDEEGEPLYSIAQIQNVTERKRADEALRSSETSLAEAQRIAHVGGWEWDLKTGEVQWSDEAYRIYGFEPHRFSPSLETVEEVFHPDDRHLLRAIVDGDTHEGESYDFEHRIVRPDGEVRWIHRRGEVALEDGESWRIIGTVHDITERKALGERLQYQAHHDLLTNLPNRQLFLDRLGQALRRTRRRPGHKAAVLFVDLDNFKVVNDSLGHEVGDLLLVRVGERLRRCLRPEDTLARFGGDEFAMLLENLQSPTDAVRVAERVGEELSNPFMLEGRELVLRASVGIALGDARTKGPGELLKDADTAMYRAKADAAGYRIFEPKMYEQALRRLEAENDMRRAIEAGEFVVDYQPIVDLQRGEVWGGEALVRWEHPERGLLYPSQFVAVAEETGLIVPLGERVLEEACRQAAKWQRGRPEASPPVVCVNISARQLGRQDLAETVEGVLRNTGLDGRCLCLDITETLYITVLEGNIAVLDDLKRMGVRISIDDFGMGHSSLSYLKRLPADTLKIDKSFVGGLGEDVEDTAIVRMTTTLAHTLGMKIVAEGVESEEQAEELREMGCDLGQGFHFAEPLPPREASEFLTR